MSEGKEHVSIVVCGHVDAGKSTTTGRLIFELGGIPEREMEKLRKEADALGKSSFAFAFYMDRQKEERERGVTIQVTTKEFFTATKHYTILDAPGHRDFIKSKTTNFLLFIFLFLFFLIFVFNTNLFLPRRHDNR